MDYTVAAVDKALGLLFLVAQLPGLGVTELAKRSGNTKARAFRLLGTLEHCGLIQRQQDSAGYSLGYRALLLGSAAQEQLSLVRLAKASLPEFGRRCNESVLVRVRQGLETVCIAWVDAPHAVRVHTQMGDRRPLHAGASGKLLLAFAPAGIQEEVLSGEFDSITPNTITGRAGFEKELAMIRAQGYAVSFGERLAETVAVAAPVRDLSGQVVAALGITGPSSRISQDDVRKLIDFVQTSARDFSQELGYAQES